MVDDATPERAFEALRRAVIALGYQIQGSDARTNTLFFKSGRTNMSGSAVPATAGNTRLSLATGKDGATIHARVAEELRTLPPEDVPQMVAGDGGGEIHHPGVFAAIGTNGRVRFDGRIITITRMGFLARATVGKGEKQIPLAHVTGVQFKPAGWAVNGFIQFTLGGGNERRSEFGSQTFDAVKDENSIVFRHSQREQFERLRDAVQAALADYHHPVPASPASGSTANVGIPEQIKQLAELRDSGLLSDSEFEAKKAELLQRM